MKRIITILLVVAMLGVLCACQQSSGTQTSATAEFKVGFGRVDITPIQMGVRLGGYGQSEKRLHTKVLDPLYVTAVAITGTNGETVILMSVDLLLSSGHNAVRKNIEQKTGVPYNNIMYSATHTHSAPDVPVEPGVEAEIAVKAVEAAELALADQAPATMAVSRTETEGLNFTRHYLMNDGTYAGSNFGDWTSGVKAHAAENDPVMQVVKFTRAAEDKKDIVMVNWQGHPCMTGGLTVPEMSADYIGSTRQQFEFQSKCQFIYFLGASGDQNVESIIGGETVTTDYHEMGRLLTEYIMGAMENMEEATAGDVKVLNMDHMGIVNREMEDRLADAIMIQGLYESTDRDTGNKLARELGFSSVYHANGVISRSGISESELPIDLTVYSFGDVSLAAIPCEVFAEHGVYVKENTPYKMTLMATCANGYICYLPTQKAFDYGCYESHTGKFIGSTGQECAEKIVEMLNTLKGD